jgi:hypothetical protein
MQPHAISFGSAELLADFSVFENAIIRRADDSKEIADHYSITYFPTILLIDIESGKVVENIRVEDSMDIARTVYFDQVAEFIHYEPPVIEKFLKKSSPKALVEKLWSDFDQTKIYIQDIESSILSMLFKDVISFPLEGSELTSLKDFVKAISVVYPSTR